MSIRFDKSQMSNVTKTPEGFLKVAAPVSRTGIFKYTNLDGTTRKELRTPEEVFKADSLASLHMKPVTNDHPQGLVSPADVKRLAVGSLGETVTRVVADGQDIVQATFIVNDAAAVKMIEDGKRGLSLGYSCDLIPAPAGALFNGDSYDFIQTNIQYNHLAIVNEGRAGAVARINMDGNEEYVEDQKTPTQEVPMLVKVKIDGIEYDAAQEVANALSRTTTRADEAEAKIVAVKADLDKAAAERDAQKERADKADAKDNTAEVQARIALLRKAESHVSEDVKANLDSMSELEIKKAVIVALSPEVKLDAATPEYIAARFDVSLEIAANKKPADDSGSHQRQVVKTPAVNKDSEDDTDPAVARKAMIARSLNGFKKE